MISPSAKAAIAAKRDATGSGGLFSAPASQARLARALSPCTHASSPWCSRMFGSSLWAKSKRSAKRLVKAGSEGGQASWFGISVSGVQTRARSRMNRLTCPRAHAVGPRVNSAKRVARMANAANILPPVIRSLRPVTPYASARLR